MKKITIFIFASLSFLFFLSNSSKVFAAEVVSCKTSVQENTVTMEVSNVENYLKENTNYDSLYIWIFHKTIWLDSAKVKYQITKSGKYSFDRTSWPKGFYPAQVDTPATFGKPFGEAASTSCNFFLDFVFGTIPVSDLCCPYGYSDIPANCGRTVLHPSFDPNTECCKYKGWGDWEFKPKIPCETIIEPVDVTCQNGEGVNTALGCIPIKPSGFVNWLLTFSIGIGGGIAFLLMIFGGFQIILSSGNPEKIKAGKEMITAAITGLLLIIFSVFILKLIGYDILKIPGFGK